MMDSLTACCINRFIFPSSSSSSRRKNLSFSRKPSFLVFASKEEQNFDHWDQMELKFGRMIGEDPKLTLAKIMGRKLNPDASYLEIEKSFHKNKGKLKNDIENLPFDVNDMCRPIDSTKNLNLVRPVLKKGMKFKSDDTPIESQLKEPSPSLGKVVSSSKASVPNVILRKPSTFYKDNVETQKPSRLKIRPNLLLKMRKEQSKDDFSDIMLLKKPEPVKISTNSDPDNASSGDSVGPSSMELIECGSTLPSRLETIGEANVSDDLEESSLSCVSASDLVNVAKNDIDGSPEPSDVSVSKLSELEDKSKLELQPIEQSDVGFTGKEAAETQSLDRNSVNSISKFSMQAELKGKPQRFDPSTKERSHPSRVETVPASDESYRDAAEVEQFLAAPPLQESEDADWKRAEDLLETGGRGEVELISGSTRGFVVSFGSLIGFLPYRNLGAKWKFLAFESWLRRKGLDPSMYKQNLGIIGSYGVQNKNPAPNVNLSPAIEQKIEGELSPDMKLEDLLEIYDQEKIKFLSSFVGQRIKVNVVMADRKSRKLMFSGRPKEKEELIEKKRSLMAKLSIGDVVKCCIKKITYFGIFVEVEGVPALIHQTEVSWDSTLNPSSYFKIGQIVEAKVHQLDFALERITLSLKQITPDPLIEALESVVGEHNSLEGRLEAVQSDVEWADVESLIKELQQIEGIQSVSKGRFFLSPGLAPTFQVYMTSMFENQYKLLARSAKKVQELFVRTSLDKEAIKAAVLSCTNRVE